VGVDGWARCPERDALGQRRGGRQANQQGCEQCRYRQFVAGSRFKVSRHHGLRALLVHGLFRKPVPTFRDHALAPCFEFNSFMGRLWLFRGPNYAYLLAHELVRKPVSTFRDHALIRT
jgi:hypothetical protein